MANFVHINMNRQDGAAVISALSQISAGLGTLAELNGRRAEAIAAGQAEMQAIFGPSTLAEAQVLSDRWDALLQALEGTVPEWAANDPYALLRDLINQTVRA